MTQGVKMNTEHITRNLTNQLRAGGYVKLDLLGMGIFSFSPEARLFYGTLDRDRAWKSMMFTSPQLTIQESDDKSPQLMKKTAAFAAKLLSF